MVKSLQARPPVCRMLPALITCTIYLTELSGREFLPEIWGVCTVKQVSQADKTASEYFARFSVGRWEPDDNTGPMWPTSLTLCTTGQGYNNTMKATAYPIPNITGFCRVPIPNTNIGLDHRHPASCVNCLWSSKGYVWHRDRERG